MGENGRQLDCAEPDQIKKTPKTVSYAFWFILECYLWYEEKVILHKKSQRKIDTSDFCLTYSLLQGLGQTFGCGAQLLLSHHIFTTLMNCWSVTGDGYQAAHIKQFYRSLLFPK